MRRPVHFCSMPYRARDCLLLESESSDDTASPEETTLVDFFIHKPGPGCI